MPSFMPSEVPTDPDRPFVVGIGGSAGAVDALQHFFEALPEDPGMAFVVVMHLAPDETSQLAEVLRSHTSLPVTQVTEATSIAPDHVYVVAPGDILQVDGTTLVPSPLQGQEGRRSPIDHLFRSLAAAPVEPMGIVLSGAGTDGSVGLRAIKEVGGLIAAQDPSEAAHDSMPRSAIETSRVDLVLPVAELARRVGEQRSLLRRLRRLDDPVQLADDEGADYLRAIFEEVRTHTGHDFSEYKQSTMLRRIRRRMQVHQVPSLADYLAFLRDQPGEAAALQKDLLISVTNFFRNPDAFAALRDDLLPGLLAGKGQNDAVRAWVVGCATGEEAYSLAMLLLEQAKANGIPAGQVQVFATDLDEEALATARKGRYPEPIAADVPARYLDRFFRRDGTEYVVRSDVHDRVLFTPHSVLKDPPFSQLDLISCRNLLIYLRRDLQESVFSIFNYALRDQGGLFLGSSESVDLADDDFETVNKSHRLYRRRKGAASVPELPSMPQAPTTPSVENPDMPAREGPSEAIAHQRLLEAYAPPSAIVDEQHRFVHLSRSAGRYLQHPGGTPNADLVDLVRPELRVKLRSALREAFAEEQPVRTPPVQVEFNGEARPVRMEVRPAPEVPEAEGLALVVFDEAEETTDGEDPSPQPAPDDHVRQLEAELDQTKNELRATVEEYETSKQEMQAANEELRSMNEEYKSMTEELETSKEELQSVNEELKTVNRELEEKVEALRRANSDLKNLMAATEIGTLFLDHDLCIQRFTPRIEDLFNIRADDVDRPIGDLTHHLHYDQLEADADAVLETQEPVEREVPSQNGTWFLVRHHPYRTAEDDVDGVVITFVDITNRKEAEQDLRTALERLKERTRQVEALSDALTSAEQAERKRLSEVLHDDLQQTIFAARLKIDQLSERAALDEKAGDLAARAVELLDTGIETTRTLSSELDPPVGDQSLRDTLEWLARHMDDAYNLSVHLKARSAVRTTDQNLCSLLYRLVRELLFNVVKHAEVDEATVFLVEGEDQLRVVVEDEGKGFEPGEHLSKNGGVGLVSIRERIEMIGGTFVVEAAPGEGTRAEIEVPWPADGADSA